MVKDALTFSKGYPAGEDPRKQASQN